MDNGTTNASRQSNDINLQTFFDNNLNLLDSDRDGLLSREEVIAGFTLCKPEDLRYLRILNSEFDKIRTLDHWYSQTIGPEDVATFQRRLRASDADHADAREITQFLKANFEKLSGDGDIIRPEDLLAARASFRAENRDTCTLDRVIARFNQIGNCSGDEHFWESRHISRADVDNYVKSVDDVLVNDARFVAGATARSIPDAISKETRRIEEHAATTLGSWNQEYKDEFCRLGKAMLSGQAEDIAAAVRRVGNPRNLAIYARELNKLFDVYGVSYERGQWDYHVHSQLSADGRKFVINNFRLQLEIPLDARAPLAGKYSNGYFWNKDASIIRMSPEYVANELANKMRSPTRRGRGGYYI